MAATPIIPGRLYAVSHAGTTRRIIAADPIHAIRLALEIVKGGNWRAEK